MAKRCILFAVFFVIRGLGFSQTAPQFTQYIFNQHYLNPAAAGMANRMMLQTTVRSQYTAYSATQYDGGNMLSSALSLDMPFQKLKGGVGLYFANQSIAKDQSKSEVALNYSFHKRLNSNILGFGLGVGINNLRLNGDEFVIRDPDDPYIPSSKMSSITPLLNAGLFLVNPSYEIGLSVKNILEPDYGFGDADGVFQEKRQYYISGKYDFGVSYTLDISPMFLVNSDLQTTVAEFGLLATFKQKFWVGANYRTQDAGSVLAGVNLLGNNLKLGYALDIVTSGADAKSNTSHELFLRYALSAPKSGKRSVVKTPRYSIQ